MRKSFGAFALATLIILAGPTAANAAAGDDDYTPPNPGGPSLSGSVAAGFCDSDAPYIRYSVVETNPSGVTSGDQANLVLSGPGNSVTIPLGTLGADGTLSGVVLWPGASVDANGAPTGWPGWEQQNGQWVQTDANFAWTRANITAVLEVNPSLRVPLSYPEQTPMCSANPPVTGSAAALPATGMTDAVVPIGIAGGALALLGGALVLGRRLARR